MKKMLSTIGITVVFTIFATTVLLYVSLAVMVGPWIDPTLALCALGLLSLASWRPVPWLTRTILLYATAAASMGGLLASAAAWSIPTLNFVDPALFALLLARPLYSVSMIALLVVIAGAVGCAVAYKASAVWNDTTSYAFPVAQLVVRTLTMLSHVSQVLQLWYGVVVTIVYHLAQLFKYIPGSLIVFAQQRIAPWLCVPTIAFTMSMVPMLCALGFIAGSLLVVPLACGMLLRTLVMSPCYTVWFAQAITEQNFVTAFCTGLIIQGVLHSFWKLLRVRGGVFRPIMSAPCCLFAWVRRVGSPHEQFKIFRGESEAGVVCIGIASTIAAGLFLSKIASFSVLAIGYILLGAVVCAYQVILLVGRIGLAPLGRFATFVMVPGMLLFRFTSLQAVIAAAFVEVACAAGATAASGMRIARDIADDNHELFMRRYQGVALVVSALTIGILMWFFAYYFGFGTSPLVAQRAQSRALLIQAHEMHLGVMMLGGVAGTVLHLLHINTTLLLGGILMPLSDTLLLVVGGALSRCVKNPQVFEPFWSGVFTTSSLWLIGKAFLG